MTTKSPADCGTRSAPVRHLRHPFHAQGAAGAAGCGTFNGVLGAEGAAVTGVPLLARTKERGKRGHPIKVPAKFGTFGTQQGKVIRYV